MTREEFWKSDGVEWRVEGKICVELGKSARVGWRVAAKIRGELGKSARVDGKMQKRFPTNF